MPNKKKTGSDIYNAFSSSLGDRFFGKRIGRKGVNLSSGNPAFSPFAPAINAAQNILTDFRIGIYGNPNGNKATRQVLLPYCEAIGLTPKDGGLKEHNILPGMGITHLYACTIEALAQKAAQEHPGKTPVLLMSSPTYGLFAIQPEPFDFEVETFL